MRPELNLYHIEVTDTFGGEANYSWVKRFACYAKSAQGAMKVVSAELGYRSRFNGYRWNFVNACICAFVEEQDDDFPNESYEYVPIGRYAYDIDRKNRIRKNLVQPKPETIAKLSD